jgi:hypothetical protein
MTSRLLTRVETNALEHDILTMYQIINTVVKTSKCRISEGWTYTFMHNSCQLRTQIKELNGSISRMSMDEFEKMKNHTVGLRQLAAKNLEQAHVLANKVKEILQVTEEHRKQQGNSPFHWEQHGLLHMELERVVGNISNLMHSLLPG